MKKLLSTVFISSLLAITNLSSSEYKRRVIYPVPPHFPQETSVSCGLAVARMWIYQINRKLPAESRLRKQFKSFLYWDTYPYSGGIQAWELRRILRSYTGKKFQRDRHRNIESAEKRLYNEIIKQRRPIAISGTTVYVNAEGKKEYHPGQHWLLVYGAKIRKKNGRYKLKYVYIHDSINGMRGSARFDFIKIGSRVKKKDFFGKWWRPYAGDHARYSVED